MAIKESALAVLPDRLSEALPEATSAHIATIVSLSADDIPQLQLAPDGPVVPARLAMAATRERIAEAIAKCLPTVVLFENGDRSKPLIVGFVEPLQPETPIAQPEEAEKNPFVEADVDGKRVRVTAQDEIVLQCGSASVTLRRNGRVIIRGTYVESHSEGTNRIKGGQVQIN
jgi:hypothetical protein